MTFLQWAKNINKEVRVYNEKAAFNAKRIRARKVEEQTGRLKANKYRHIMIEDNKDRIPFNNNSENTN